MGQTWDGGDIAFNKEFYDNIKDIYENGIRGVELLEELISFDHQNFIPDSSTNLSNNDSSTNLSNNNKNSFFCSSVKLQIEFCCPSLKVESII